MSSVDEILDDNFPIISQYFGVSHGRHRATTMAVKHTVDNKAAGDYVECGVFRGASVMNMALTLLHCNCTDRKNYLYDTFEGMPDTTPEDGQVAREYVSKYKAGEVHGCLCNEDIIRENVVSTGYPEENYIFVRGEVEKTLPNSFHERIAILRLDTDWYKSSLHELVHMFPLLVRGGVLLLDDYFLWPGKKKATDEYFMKKGLNIAKLQKTDGGAIYSN